MRWGDVIVAQHSSRGKWEIYRERHSDLADEENERFRVIFGPEFAAEYKNSGEAIRPVEVPQLAQDGRHAMEVARGGLPIGKAAPAPGPQVPFDPRLGPPR